jgi:hypothetical protein
MQYQLFVDSRLGRPEPWSFPHQSLVGAGRVGYLVFEAVSRKAVEHAELVEPKPRPRMLNVSVATRLLFVGETIAFLICHRKRMLLSESGQSCYCLMLPLW